MEQELFFTGYCRQIDQSRMVCMVHNAATLLDCDCCYGTCLYQPECPIAKQITEALEKSILTQ